MTDTPLPRLFLFDIDGTLLRTHGAGSRSLAQAFEEVLGTRPPLHTISFAGRTDTEILHDLLQRMDIPESQRPEVEQALVQRFTKILQEELETHPPEVLPGVPELLTRLQETPDSYLGLVTGNLKPTAYLKLGAAGLADYFPVGGFGSDSPHRDHLPAIAVKRARVHYGLDTFSPLTVYVIGDTPRDIQCSRALPARSVAVCTGPYSCEELAAHQPDWLFPDFRATDTVLETLLTNGKTHH